MKFKNIAILVLSTTVAAGAVTYLANKREYKPRLGNELYNEAKLTQEKYRKLKSEGKTLDDFTQPVKKVKTDYENRGNNYLEEKINKTQTYEPYNEYFKDPTGELYLQRSSFKNEKRAIRLVKGLRKKGLDANYFIKDNWYVVYLGPLNGIDDVLAAENKFYSLYPTKYMLLKGPIDTNELKIEREKNLIRRSLVKFSTFMRKNDFYNAKKYADKDIINYFVSKTCGKVGIEVDPYRSSFRDYSTFFKVKDYKILIKNIKINGGGCPIAFYTEKSTITCNGISVTTDGLIDDNPICKSDKGIYYIGQY